MKNRKLCLMSSWGVNVLHNPYTLLVPSLWNPCALPAYFRLNMIWLWMNNDVGSMSGTRKECARSSQFGWRECSGVTQGACKEFTPHGLTHFGLGCFKTSFLKSHFDNSRNSILFPIYRLKHKYIIINSKSIIDLNLDSWQIGLMRQYMSWCLNFNLYVFKHVYK